MEARHLRRLARLALGLRSARGRRRRPRSPARWARGGRSQSRRGYAAFLPAMREQEREGERGRERKRGGGREREEVCYGHDETDSIRPSSMRPVYGHDVTAMRAGEGREREREERYVTALMRQIRYWCAVRAALVSWQKLCLGHISN